MIAPPLREPPLSHAAASPCRRSRLVDGAEFLCRNWGMVLATDDDDLATDLGTFLGVTHLLLLLCSFVSNRKSRKKKKKVAFGGGGGDGAGA